MKRIIFDIETMPLPETDINMIAPKFEAPANYKDPEKIKVHIEGQRAAWMERAALSPLTGQVCAIGALDDLDNHVMWFADQQSDAGVLKLFWDLFRDESDHSLFIGFNIFGFDLPFMMRRSWKLGIKMPLDLRSGRFFNTAHFVDLADTWKLGSREEYISLDQLARFLGAGTKNGDGEFFYKLPLDQKRKYLLNDLEMTKRCAAKIL